MVRALLDGRKTMTRRRAKREFVKASESKDGRAILVPSAWARVQPGDRLWVRETWARTSITPIVSTIENPWVVFRECDNRCDYGGPWRSPIHLARKDSRLTLVITATKIERLQTITKADALAEGIDGLWLVQNHVPPPRKSSFRDLWDDLHGAGSWDANSEVVALTFAVHKCKINAMPKSEAA